MKLGRRNSKLWQFIPAFLLLLLVQNVHSQEFCITAGADQKTGKQGDYSYELWNQNSKGTACMTLGSGGSFSGRWSGIENYLARRGLKYDETKTHQQIGTFNTKYNCTYNPASSGGNSYLAIYGWTVSPMIEYYIVEDWRSWIPSMAAGTSSKGTLNIDGSVYDIYQATRTQQPSIKGTATFQQYFSIRKNPRNTGSIQISEHFKKWESLGMPMGKMYEVSFVVEGYQNSGTFDFKELEMTVGSGPSALSAAQLSPFPLKIAQVPNSRALAITLDPSLQRPMIHVYNTAGALVDSRNDQHSVQFSNMNTGLYFVKVQSMDQSYTSRVVVH